MSFPNSETILILDGDILLYSIGFGSEDIQESWIVDQRVERFFERLFDKFGVYNYKLYLTGKNNFREEAATTHTYKGNRTKPKPRWYSYIKDYLIHMHNTVVVEGYEADDAMAMNMTRNPNSICCTIDKDLRMVKGWHYSWATHNRPEQPLEYITQEGYLELQVTERKNKEGKVVRKSKLTGGGTKWFYAQLLMGDKTDNIIGPQGVGDVKAHNVLKDCETEKELYQNVSEVYQQSFGEEAEQRLMENAYLLWMVVEMDDNGELVMWEKPE